MTTGAEGPYRDWDRAEILPFLPAGARTILDVGCSYGGFGALLKSRYPSTHILGVELAENAASVAAERLDGVVCGRFPGDLPPEWGPFDVVTFNDVLEHVEDPWSTLRDTRSWLAIGGAVVASIPNVRYVNNLIQLVVRGRWDYVDAGTLDRTHLRFFTRSTVQDLFESSGYEVLRLEPINTGHSTSRTARAMRLLGHRFDDFLAYQYVAVATPVRQL